MGKRGFRDLSLRERDSHRLVPFSLPKSDEGGGWYWSGQKVVEMNAGYPVLVRRFPLAQRPATYMHYPHDIRLRVFFLDALGVGCDYFVLCFNPNFCPT